MARSRLANFFDGFASAFDLYGVTVEMPELPSLSTERSHACVREDEASALRGDWQRIGDDMRRVFASISQAEHEQA